MQDDVPISTQLLYFYACGCCLAAFMQFSGRGDWISETDRPTRWWVHAAAILLWPLQAPFSFLVLAVVFLVYTASRLMWLGEKIGLQWSINGKPTSSRKLLNLEEAGGL